MKIKKSAKPHGSIFAASFGIILAFLGYIICSLLMKSSNSSSRYFVFNGSGQKFDLESILPPSGYLLKSIAIPRVSGTAGNVQVRAFIKSQFSPRFWDVEEDSHLIDSAHGPSTEFVNLIFTLKTASINEDRIILAAHYDSKALELDGLSEEKEESIKKAVLEGSKFVGATDSAWSCALMIAIGKSVENLNHHNKQNTKNDNHHVLNRKFQLIFFDGEEAVHRWGPNDSLYGSRALAQKWSLLPPESPNSLSKINLFVLLDLLGTRVSSLHSFHPAGTTIDAQFNELIVLERSLFNDNKIFSSDSHYKAYKGSAVEDDHTPFLEFSIPVLHLIPLPFPPVWHTMKDDISALDRDECEKLALIIYKFIINKINH